MSMPVEIEVHHVSSFDLDDAFNEDDDNELPYQFSPDIIREDLAQNFSSIETTWDNTAISTTSSIENISVSTLDINGQDAQASLSACESISSKRDGYSDSEKFKQIYLSQEETNQPVEIKAGSDYENEGNIMTVIDVQGAVHVPLPLSTEVPMGLDNTARAEDIISNGHHTSSDSHADTLSSSSLPHRDPPGTSSSTHIAGFSTPSLPIPPPMSDSVRTQSSSSKPSNHRPTRSIGPSVFEKVRSKTRPPFLPPKPKKEDEKHMADWQHMMKLSRTAAEKRRKALQERRLAREKNIDDSLHIWENDLLPDWRAVHRNPALKRLWWQGIPTKLRAIMWERAVGNDLALNKDHYRTCLSRAKRALTSGIFPKPTLDMMEEDISTTLPALHIFHPESGPLYSDLKDMLYAWVVSRSDEGLGYSMGAARIAAMILITMPQQQGFIVMRNLLERHCLRSFFGGERAKDDVEAYYRIFDTLLADGMPKIYFNFKQHQISPAAYLPDWIGPLFLDHLPFEACARLWDVLLLEGDSFLYRASLAVLAVLEPRLFFPDRKELLDLLKGENKAALDVAKREGRSLDGGKYEIYGLDEETLWERIDSMDEWWKESTWTRLIQRELPDL